MGLTEQQQLNMVRCLDGVVRHWFDAFPRDYETQFAGGEEQIAWLRQDGLTRREAEAVADETEEEMLADFYDGLDDDEPSFERINRSILAELDG